MRGIEVWQLLQRLNKPYYSIADLEKVTRLPRNSLYVALKRWASVGILVRIGQGIYVPMGNKTSMENVAAQLYLPNYLSFESALARYGVLNLIPYTLTFATTRRTKKLTLQETEIEFRQISASLFWGFEMNNGIYIATPEKAFLDQIYFMARGKATLDLDELNLKILAVNKLRDYVSRFPSYVQRYIERTFKL